MESGRSKKKEARYDLLFKLASGGMATVYVGSVRGSMGFRQLVAIKEPHPNLLDDPAYRKELLAEARLASLIHHVNVVDVRDVYVASDDMHGKQIRLVMDYIEGASFGELLVLASRANERIPARVVVRIILDACAGLHAAHELVDEKGRAVGLVHRDVSPQNILVGVDGATRVSDFGVAKATSLAVTNSGSLKGKLAYMSPEYVQGRLIDRRVDVFAIGVVAWEALCGKRLFRGENEVDTAQRILSRDAPPVSSEAPELAAFDDVIATALAKKPENRFATTQAFAAALESVARQDLAGHAEVAAIVKRLAATHLEARRALVREKLSAEPGFLSLMGADPPSMPASSKSWDERQAQPAATVPDMPPIVYRSAEPTTSDTALPAGVPSSRPLLIGLVAFVALASGATTVFFAMHKTESARPSEPAVESAIASASAPPVIAVSLAPLSSQPIAPRPSATHARPAATATGTATVTATVTATASGPPPNPYN